MLYPYIPIEKRLLTDAELGVMGKRLKRAGVVTSDAIGATLALGGLCRLWALADDHLRDDNTMAIDREKLTADAGFDVLAFLPPNWGRVIDEFHVELPDFRQKNSSLARARQGAAERRREQRQTARSVSASAPPSTSPSMSRQSATPELANLATELTHPTHTPPRLSVSDEHSLGRFLEVYPAHAGELHRERVAYAALQVIRQKRARWEDLISGAQRYREYVQACGRMGTQFVKSPLAFVQESMWAATFILPKDDTALDMDRLHQLVASGQPGV